MASLAIPPVGLSLQGSPDVDIGNPRPGTKPPQAMRLSLPDNLIKELLKSESRGRTARIAFGNTIFLHYGEQKREVLQTTENFRHELYFPVAGAESERLSFAGIVSHNLEVQDIEKVPTSEDPAVLALKEKYAAIEQARKSHTTTYVGGTSPHPPAVSGRRGLVKANQPRGRLDSHRTKLLGNGLTRSMPTSPALGASRSPMISAQPPPTSTPVLQDEKTMKLQALRKPFIHLLAIEPVLEKHLIQKTRCSTTECAQLLKKVGRLTRDNSAWELSDRTYKDLDVWAFPYPSQAARQAAIQNAISAFDRMRIGKEEPIWQNLLPKHERGRGKVLSRLDLDRGPRQAGSTPTIRVQRVEDPTPKSKASSPEKEDLASKAAGENKVRSASQPPTKRQKISEREVQSRRLLTTNSSNMAKAKSARSVQKPSTSKTSTKYKSEEFVQDSDSPEEKVPPRTAPVKSATSSHSSQGNENKIRQRSDTSNSKSSSSSSKALAAKSTQDKKPSHKSSTLETPKAKPLPSQSPRLDGNVRTGHARHRSSTSPQKPSPLSSPPENMSELEMDQYNVTSSSSSSPLINQVRRSLATPSLVGDTSSTVRGSSQNDANSLKRKFDDTDSSDFKAPSQNGVNGFGPHQSTAKKYPEVFSSSSSGTTPDDKYHALNLAKRFKHLYKRYENLHREVSAQSKPDPRKVAEVKRLHKRLAEWKKQIAEAAEEL